MMPLPCDASFSMWCLLYVMSWDVKKFQSRPWYSLLYGYKRNLQGKKVFEKNIDWCTLSENVNFPRSSWSSQISLVILHEPGRFFEMVHDLGPPVGRLKYRKQFCTNPAGFSRWFKILVWCGTRKYKVPAATAIPPSHSPRVIICDEIILLVTDGTANVFSVGTGLYFIRISYLILPFAVLDAVNVGRQGKGHLGVPRYPGMRHQSVEKVIKFFAEVIRPRVDQMSHLPVQRANSLKFCMSATST